MSERCRFAEDFDFHCSLLLICHEECDRDEEELLLRLHALQNDACLALLPFVGPRLCLDRVDEETCIRRFRFNREEIHQLLDAVDMLVRFSAPCRITWTSM